MNKQQRGFTIIELMIATMVFSIILLGATTALFQLEKMYYRGIITARVQTASRSVMASISQQLQFNQDTFIQAADKSAANRDAYAPGLIVQGFCIGTTRYSYVIDGQVEQGTSGYNADGKHHIQHALWRDTISATDTCSPVDLTQPKPSGNGAELLQQNMRLASLSVDPKCATSRICQIEINIIYGDDDLLAPDAIKPVACRSTFGDQWCATSSLSTTVFRRLQKDSSS